ncbi:MAG: DNA polymerase III subunit gamma/tau, partial [Ruthenibacterium sp.]
DPCCKCSVCTGIDDGSVMDVVEIDAASNNGVDNIRDLRDETAYTPSVGTYKVYIIDEVHMLSTAAFNALLKIMEEPPSHVIFILATTEIHKVPATILSRCQRYDFTRISPEKITGRLLYIAKEEKIPLTDGAAGLIARLADGAMRDALSILDTCAGVTDEVNEDVVRRMAGVTDKTYLFDLGQAIANKDAPNALALVATLREKSIDIKRLCDELVLHYRNLLLAGVADGQNLLTGVSVEEEQRYLEAAKTISQQEALRGIQMFCEALDKMGKGTDARIELELAIFKLCTPDVQVQTMVPPQAAPQTFASAP